MIGTSASAGWSPIQKNANQDRPPAAIRYGQKLFDPDAAQSHAPRRSRPRESRPPPISRTSIVGLTARARGTRSHRTRCRAGAGTGSIGCLPKMSLRDEVDDGEIDRKRHRPGRRRASARPAASTTGRGCRAGTTLAPIDATTGSNARRHGCSTPPGAVASTTSFVINAKKNTIATSFTANAIA